MGPLLQLESNLTSLSLDLEWFAFLLSNLLLLLLNKRGSSKKNGAVSPGEIKSDQLKFGFRMFSFFACQIYFGGKNIYYFFGTFMIFVGQVYGGSFLCLLSAHSPPVLFQVVAGL